MVRFQGAAAFQAGGIARLSLVGLAVMTVGLGQAAAQSSRGAPIVFASGLGAETAQPRADVPDERVAGLSAYAPSGKSAPAAGAWTLLPGAGGGEPTPATYPAPSETSARLMAPDPTSDYSNPNARAVAGLSGRLAEPYAGPPYEVEGKWFVPTHEPNYDEVGIASWYGPNFHGKASASGETFDTDAMTAAHPTLPIPSLVRVTNLQTNQSVVVRLNDRGPFVDDRIIDLSRRAAEALDVVEKGTAKVRVQFLGPAPIEENALPDGRFMAAAPPSARKPAQSPLQQVSASSLPTLQPTPTPDRRPSLRSDASIRGFYVQAGSFVDLSNALELRETLSAIGPVFVTEADVNGAHHFRVMIGPWASRDEATMVQGQVIEQGGRAFVVARSD
ncbi:septal ring lytic transglycosylase RlpA family protein [bacterium]|nr:septal ring lytic transglycosylase RlpA family protein [bacterium]